MPNVVENIRQDIGNLKVARRPWGSAKNEILDYIIAHPGATRKDIMANCHTSSSLTAKNVRSLLIERHIHGDKDAEKHNTKFYFGKGTGRPPKVELTEEKYITLKEYDRRFKRHPNLAIKWIKNGRLEGYKTEATPGNLAKWMILESSAQKLEDSGTLQRRPRNPISKKPRKPKAKWPKKAQGKPKRISFYKWLTKYAFRKD